MEVGGNSLVDPARFCHRAAADPALRTLLAHRGRLVLTSHMSHSILL